MEPLVAAAPAITRLPSSRLRLVVVLHRIFNLRYGWRSRKSPRRRSWLETLEGRSICRYIPAWRVRIFHVTG
jgi:hypothetical protein